MFSRLQQLIRLFYKKGVQILLSKWVSCLVITIMLYTTHDTTHISPLVLTRSDIRTPREEGIMGYRWPLYLQLNHQRLEWGISISAYSRYFLLISHDIVQKRLRGSDFNEQEETQGYHHINWRQTSTDGVILNFIFNPVQN